MSSHVETAGQRLFEDGDAGREGAAAQLAPPNGLAEARENLQSADAVHCNRRQRYAESVRARAPDMAHVLLIDERCKRQSRLGAVRDEFGLQGAVVLTYEEAHERIPALRSVGAVVMSCHEAHAAICESVNALRRRAARPLPFVLLVSALSFDALKRIARTGPVDVLSPSVDHDDLVASVRRAVEWFAPAEQLPENSNNNVLTMLAGIEARLNDLARAPVQDLNDGLPPLRRRADRAHMVLHEAGVDRDMIKAVMRFRAAQKEILGASLIDDAAWVMLLDLLMMYLERKKLAVTSLYIGSGAPVATALRRLNQLLDEGLAVKVPDPSDRRRTLVEITPKGVEGVCAMLNHMKTAFSVRGGD